MTTGRQIRAARMLVDWDAEDLAKRTGLTRETIFNIERGVFRPRPKTLDKIIKVFSEASVEFIGNEGVKHKSEDVEIFEGVARFNEFYDFLYEHLKKYGGEVCLSIVDEKLLAKYRKKPNVHRKRMKQLVDKGVVSFRIIANESNFVSEYAKYKWVPRQSSLPTSFYAFGNCLALISFNHTNPPYIVVIKSAPITEAYRSAFNVLWENAKDPEKIFRSKT